MSFAFEVKVYQNYSAIRDDGYNRASMGAFCGHTEQVDMEVVSETARRPKKLLGPTEVFSSGCS